MFDKFLDALLGGRLDIDPERAKVLEFPPGVGESLSELLLDICYLCGEEKKAFLTMWVLWKKKGIMVQICRECAIEKLSDEWYMALAYRKIKEVYPWMNFDEDSEPPKLEWEAPRMELSPAKMRPYGGDGDGTEND
jgi:hypothetical protein